MDNRPLGSINVLCAIMIACACTFHAMKWQCIGVFNATAFICIYASEDFGVVNAECPRAGIGVVNAECPRPVKHYFKRSVFSLINVVEHMDKE